MTDFGLAVAKTQQAAGNEPQAIQKLKVSEAAVGAHVVRLIAPREWSRKSGPKGSHAFSISPDHGAILCAQTTACSRRAVGARLVSGNKAGK
jgi:hypothetical protein